MEKERKTHNSRIGGRRKSSKRRKNRGIERERVKGTESRKECEMERESKSKDNERRDGGVRESLGGRG